MLSSFAVVLVIRAEQVEALAASPRRAFAPRVEAFIRERLVPSYPALGRIELGPLIERGMEAAARHGIDRRWDLCRFVVCWCVLGEAFDTSPAHPWPQRVLAREDLSPTAKMDQIERHYLRQRIRRSR